MGHYTAAFLPVEPMPIAVATLLVMTGLHAFDLMIGRAFQIGATLLKVILIVLFCVAGLAHGPVPGSLPLMSAPDSLDLIFSAPFALSLIYVSYAYSGWNAAAYLADEVQEPQRTVPRALVHGTLAVTGLYLLLNLVFLRTVTLEELTGTVEVGALSARQIFGPGGGVILSLALSLLLASTISAMVLAGPRVLQRIGEDVPALRFLSALNRRGAPMRAVLLQQGLALGFVLTDSFAGVLTFSGFTLTLFALLTVVGVFRLRRREPDLPRPFRIPLYPLPPFLFVLVSGISLLVVGWEQPLPVSAGLLLLVLGGWLLPGGSRKRMRRGP